MQKYALLMECRAGVRHAWKTNMIIKLPDDTFKLHKVCMNCKSDKYPIWSARGVILKSSAYKYSAAYREFINNHNPVEARVAILNSDVRKVEAPHGRTNPPGLRLVHGKKAGARRHKVKPVRRAKDKRRSA